MFCISETLRNAPFLDVEVYRNGAIPPVYDIVLIVNILYDRCRPIVRQVPIFRDAWPTLSPIWPDPVIFGKRPLGAFNILSMTTVTFLSGFFIPFDPPCFFPHVFSGMIYNKYHETCYDGANKRQENQKSPWFMKYLLSDDNTRRLIAVSRGCEFHIICVIYVHVDLPDEFISRDAFICIIEIIAI